MYPVKLTKCMLILLSTAFLFAIPLSARSQQITHSRVQQAYQEYENLRRSTVTIPWQKRAERLKSKYRTVLGKEAAVRKVLPSLTDDDLRLLYRAATDMTSITKDPSYLAAARFYLSELQARNAAVKQQYAELYERYVASRQFSEARNLLKLHPSLSVSPPPRIIARSDIEGNGPTVLSASGGGNVFERKSLQLDRSARIVIVAHPLCHFTQNAVRELSGMPDLWNTLTKHAIWISPQDGRLDAKVFGAWNKAHPGAPINIVYRQAEWPMIDLWGTPIFYFFKNGKLVTKVVGWPAGGHTAELLDGIHKLGLRVSSTIPNSE